MQEAAKIKQFTAGSCYSYILSSSNAALIIDPHISLAQEYINYLEKNNFDLKYIIDTHTHADHFSLTAVLKNKFKTPYLLHEKAISSIADRRLKDSDEIQLGSTRLKVIYSPGHTDDSVSLLTDGNLFTGDVLLIDSVGRTDFQNGFPESMFDTLEKLKALPDETVIFPAHDYHEKKSSNLAQQKKTNPFLKEVNKEDFVRNLRSKTIPKPFNIDNIIRVNQKGEALSLEMVSPKDAYAQAAKDPNVKLLDVRSALEFNEKHIKDVLNIPIDMLQTKINELSQTKQRYIVLCRTGNRSPMAADMLIQSGIPSIKVLEGGMVRWEKEKLPIIKSQAGISLERQVRVIAGILVLIGILLALFIHRAFIIIPLFISCSLIYAGLTDNCMMGMLLMKLPYNKKQYKTKFGGGTCSVQ